MKFTSITPDTTKQKRLNIVVRQEVVKIDKAAFVGCTKLTAITLEDAKKIVENALCAINRATAKRNKTTTTRASR